MKAFLIDAKHKGIVWGSNGQDYLLYRGKMGNYFAVLTYWNLAISIKFFEPKNILNPWRISPKQTCQNKKWSFTKRFTFSHFHTSRFRTWQANSDTFCMFTISHLFSFTAASRAWEEKTSSFSYNLNTIEYMIRVVSCGKLLLPCYSAVNSQTGEEKELVDKLISNRKNEENMFLEERPKTSCFCVCKFQSFNYNINKFVFN